MSESLNLRLTLSCPVAVFGSLSVLIDLNQVNLSYLYRIVKGAPLPSYQRRINVVPTPYLPRTNFGLLFPVIVLWVGYASRSLIAGKPKDLYNYE